MVVLENQEKPFRYFLPGGNAKRPSSIEKKIRQGRLNTLKVFS
jgi:hypothetical protein